MCHLPFLVQTFLPPSVLWSTAITPVYTTRPPNWPPEASNLLRSRQLAVLDPAPDNPVRQLLAKYPGLTRPKFSISTPPHHVVHYIQTTGPPVFCRFSVWRLHDCLPPRPSTGIFSRFVKLKALAPRPSTWF
uniref:Uncharacterized protein n=1 Tax=Schistocephalus solidus TaxID=70667 RepID=A0A0V0J3H1_SCHSO